MNMKIDLDSYLKSLGTVSGTKWRKQAERRGCSQKHTLQKGLTE